MKIKNIALLLVGCGSNGQTTSSSILKTNLISENNLWMISFLNNGGKNL